jgi:type III pantothenate kinase
MNLIAIDIGNSSINMGFFIEERLFVHRIDTHPLMSASGYTGVINSFIKENNSHMTFEGSIISSVVPDHTSAIGEACENLCGKNPLIVTSELMTGIDLQINDPERLGADRIAASTGACDLFGVPVAVIDFGTATTINFINRKREYIGGVIMPGIKLMKNALFNETAQLPDIEIAMPLSPLGKDTKGNILSGIIYGTIGGAERIISEVEQIEGENFKIVATGGNAQHVAPFFKRLDKIEPFLVLKGLKIIYDRVCQPCHRQGGIYNA